jgi:hypothetical protein
MRPLVLYVLLPEFYIGRSCMSTVRVILIGSKRGMISP